MKVPVEDPGIFEVIKQYPSNISNSTSISPIDSKRGYITSNSQDHPNLFRYELSGKGKFSVFPVDEDSSTLFIIFL